MLFLSNGEISVQTNNSTENTACQYLENFNLYNYKNLPLPFLFEDSTMTFHLLMNDFVSE